MYVRKVLITGVAMLILSSFFSSAAYCGEEFPDWVPKEVIEKAKEILVSDETHSEFSSEMTKEDLIKRELKYPFKLVRVDYKNYSKGDSIQKYFKRLRSSGNKGFGFGFGFGLYLDDVRVATLEIGYINGNLRLIGSSKRMRGAADELPKIYEDYPPEKGYIIIRDLIGMAAFFVEKDNEIIQVITNNPPKGIDYSDPEQHMMTEKERLIEHKKKVHVRPRVEPQ